MAHDLLISCENCNEQVTASNVSLDIDNVTVSFFAKCVCGFEKNYNNIAEGEFEKLSLDEIEHYKKWSGLSYETIVNYVYPPDIMNTVDLERRKIKGMKIKEALKKSRRSYPQESEVGWWEVYDLKKPKLKIRYNLKSKSYKSIGKNWLGNSRTTKYKDIYELGHALEKHF